MIVGRTTLEERDAARFANLGGYVFLVVHALTWLVASVLSYFLELEVAALVYLFQGLLAFPASLVVERWLGYPLLGRENSLTPLYIQVASVQIVALPAVIYVFDLDPLLVPAAFAAVGGAHFLPYVWLQRTPIYGVLAVFTAFAPWGLIIALGREAAFNIIGFTIGAGFLAAGLGVWAVVGRDRALAGADDKR